MKQSVSAGRNDSTNVLSLCVAGILDTCDVICEYAAILHHDHVIKQFERCEIARTHGEDRQLRTDENSDHCVNDFSIELLRSC